MMSSQQVEDEQAHDERSPLLTRDSGERHNTLRRRVPASIAQRLYVSHFLSTWNSRLFEFGAVLYLATIFPGTLMPMSLYALARGLSAVVFAPAVGLYIDTGNRLQVVRVSIVFQRLIVAASCAVFYVLATDLSPGPGGRVGMLVLVSFFACVEKLCSIMNIVSIEKDWVVIVAERDPEALGVMNAQMRRIDLLCKLFGPLFIALIDGYTTEAAIVANFAMNAASVIFEYFAIARVYYDVPELQENKQKPLSGPPEAESLRGLRGLAGSSWMRLLALARKSARDFLFYFRHRAFLPSIAGAILYLTVLSFGGQMITYLLSAGYNSTQVGIARTLSVVFEVLATWVAPWLMGQVGAVRAGLWFSSWQIGMLVTGTAVFWVSESNSLVSASGLVGGTILSRLGLRGFDLCVQLIVQEEVEPESRGAFSSVEAAWQDAFELISYASTIIFFRPNQFKWPSLISVSAVAMASVAYTTFVYLRRGHLLHLHKLTGFLGSRKGKQREHDRGIDRLTSRTDII